MVFLLTKHMTCDKAQIMKIIGILSTYWLIEIREYIVTLRQKLIYMHMNDQMEIKHFIIKYSKYVDGSKYSSV